MTHETTALLFLFNQVVLIHTSLSGVRRHFYGSLRAKQFLDVKGVVYYQIDANRDFSTAASKFIAVTLQTEVVPSKLGEVKESYQRLIHNLFLF